MLGAQPYYILRLGFHDRNILNFFNDLSGIGSILGCPIMSQANIKRYFDDDCLIPALKAIGQSRQVVARDDLLPHHETHFEIHIINNGTVNWWVEDEIYALEPGSVFLTKPGELHGGIKNIMQPSTLTWLQVDASFLKDSSIEQELLEISERQASSTPELLQLLETMLEEIETPKADSPRLLTAYLDIFLSKLLRQYQHKTSDENLPEVCRVLFKYIDEHITAEEPIKVEDLCNHVGLSRSRIFQLFEEHVGQSPIAYINRRRVERAKHYLRQTKQQITQIALELGYSSSQHFATAFKRLTGLSPKEYRKSAFTVTEEQRHLGRRHNRGHKE